VYFDSNIILFNFNNRRADIHFSAMEEIISVWNCFDIFEPVLLFLRG